MDEFVWALWIIGGLVVAVSAVTALRGLWLLIVSSGWLVATGTVSDVRVSVTGTGQNRSTRIHLQVDFQTAAGETRRAVAPYFSFLGTAPAVGSPVAVRYAPDAARRVVIDKLSSRGLPELIGGLLVLGMAAFVLRSGLDSWAF